MSNTDKHQEAGQSNEPQTLGVLGQFRNPADLKTAARGLRRAGIEVVDAHSPFPIHGMDSALGVQPTRLPWLALAAGIVGGVGAMALQWWTNAVDYPYLISGKPLFSLPANIPVTFEVIILFAALTCFFGMLLLNGLPKLANPLLRSDRFRKATDDGFFLFVDASDRQFDRTQIVDLLDDLEATHVEILTKESDQDSRLPRSLLIAATVLGSLLLVPPLVVASARSTKSEKPRWHNFFNMDFQPKFKSQTASTLFADGRAMRSRVVGTIARGEMPADTELLTGIQTGQGLTTTTSMPADRVDGSGSVQPNWVSEIPLPVTDELMQRGRERFNIHCAVCHGRTGLGNGLASLRAIELQQGTWVPPTSIHADYVRQQPVGQLFHSITHGVRKMPAYGHQIPPEDRWAIVLYVRALQRSQAAQLEDVPEDKRITLREMN